jgi:hypothetical protein
MSELNIQRLDAGAADFETSLQKLLAWEAVSDSSVNATVDEILGRVRTEGDAAVVEYSNRFDRVGVSSMAELELSRERPATRSPPSSPAWSPPSPPSRRSAWCSSRCSVSASPSTPASSTRA